MKIINNSTATEGLTPPPPLGSLFTTGVGSGQFGFGRGPSFWNFGAAVPGNRPVFCRFSSDSWCGSLSGIGFWFVIGEANIGPI